MLLLTSNNAAYIDDTYWYGQLYNLKIFSKYSMPISTIEIDLFSSCEQEEFLKSCHFIFANVESSLFIGAQW